MAYSAAIPMWLTKSAAIQYQRKPIMTVANVWKKAMAI